MSAIKNKQDLINKINDIIINQSKKRDSKNTFSLKKLGFSINSFKFIHSKEKKLVDDTIKVLIDFYDDNKDIDKNPNKLPDNFFKKILEDISSTDSDINLNINSCEDSDKNFGKLLKGNCNKLKTQSDKRISEVCSKKKEDYKYPVARTVCKKTCNNCEDEKIEEKLVAENKEEESVKTTELDKEANEEDNENIETTEVDKEEDNKEYMTYTISL